MRVCALVLAAAAAGLARGTPPPSSTDAAAATGVVHDAAAFATAVAALELDASNACQMEAVARLDVSCAAMTEEDLRLVAVSLLNCQVRGSACVRARRPVHHNK